MRLFLIVHVHLLVLLAANAADPAWWRAPETRIIDPNSSPSNYSPVNLGQLKYVAKQARLHLELELSAIGGAGPQIDTLVLGLSSDPASNYSPANLGQVKALASGFYNRLIAIGYDTRQNLIDHGYPAGWSFAYPWNPATPKNENYAPANIGQLKAVFSFSLEGFDVSEVDADGDGMYDAWEQQFGLSPTEWNDPNADSDGDGMSDFQEFLYGRNPSKGAVSDPDGAATGLVIYAPAP